MTGGGTKKIGMDDDEGSGSVKGMSESEDSDAEPPRTQFTKYPSALSDTEINSRTMTVLERKLKRANSYDV